MALVVDPLPLDDRGDSAGELEQERLQILAVDRGAEAGGRVFDQQRRGAPGGQADELVDLALGIRGGRRAAEHPAALRVLRGLGSAGGVGDFDDPAGAVELGDGLVAGVVGHGHAPLLVCS